jgi:hypothetical protein
MTEIEISRMVAGALDDSGLFFRYDHFSQFPSVERAAWIVRVLRRMEDTPRLFPHGKWATIQAIEDQLDRAVEQHLAAYLAVSPVEWARVGGAVVSTAELRASERNILQRALELRRYGADGVYPIGFQRAVFDRLESRGLLRFAGYGVDIDGPPDTERPLWEITPAGAEAIR